MLEDFKVVGPFDRERTPQFNAEDTVNWYIILDERGKKPSALSGTPGLSFDSVLQAGTFAVRQLIVFQNVIYQIAGNNVYKNGTLIGSIGTFTGYVDYAINDAGEIILVDGQAGYIIDTGANTFGPITSANFPSQPIGVIFLNGYFVVCIANSNKVVYSALNQGTRYDQFSYFVVNAYQGNLIGVQVINTYIFFFKELSTEVWYNAGLAGLPFRPVNNSAWEYGSLATSSIQSDFGYIFFLSKDKSGVSSVMMTTGGQPQAVSWPSLDNIIRNFTNPSDVFCYIYKDDGHIFYVMNWTTDDFTAVYDVTTNAWHRMQMQPHKPITGQPNSGKVRHIGNCHCFLNDVHYIGSYKDSTIYKMSLDYGDNAGEPIIRERVLRHLSLPNYNRQQIDMIQVDFNTGIGTNSGLYQFPKVYMQTTKNRGMSFGNKSAAFLSKLGQYQQRTIWRQKGISRDFVAKISLSTTIPRIFMLGGAISRKELPA